MYTFKISVDHDFGKQLKNVLQTVRNQKEYARSKGFNLLIDPKRTRVVGYHILKTKIEDTTFNQDQLVRTYDVKKQNDALHLLFSESHYGMKESQKINAFGPIIFQISTSSVYIFGFLSVFFHKIALLENTIFFRSEDNFSNIDGFEPCTDMDYLYAKNQSEIHVTNNLFYYLHD